MAFLGGLGCVLSMFGIIWGIFIPDCVWLAFLGLGLMAFATIFLDEE